ncbi:MAG: PPK2 family polyphosphate kinase [Acidimicrobiia bacterium]
MLDELLVPPGSSVRLSSFEPGETFGWDKEEANLELVTQLERLRALQTRLYVESTRSVLVVLQARDAGGKDGVIRNIFTGVNPSGVKVTSFKVPAGSEAEHDYLWRVHAACPAKGEIGIFNRSHYEDVLVVRVKQLVPKDRWRRRYRHIREFERMLSDEGTTIVKIYLNVSKEEQRERFQDRIDDPEERWKFRIGDLDDRKLWPEYTKAYEEAFAETSTAEAPWHVVPGDKKWARDLAVAKLLVETLERLDPQFPEPEPGLEGLKVT